MHCLYPTLSSANLDTAYTKLIRGWITHKKFVDSTKLLCVTHHDDISILNMHKENNTNRTL